MSQHRRSSRLYRRGGRWWGDFRDYQDVGGRREPLIPPGEHFGTTDPDVAQALLAARLKALDGFRRDRNLHGVTGHVSLSDFARDHLIAKARAGAASSWLEMHQVFLDRAVDQFGDDRPLTGIGVTDVEEWISALRERKAKGSTRVLSDGSIRHHLNALSNLYRRAQARRLVLPGYNPVAALLEKPTARRREARWLEVHDAALLLEAARTLPRSTTGGSQSPYGYALLATFLLTGGREAEVLGLEVADVSFERKTVTFRPNAWRGLKTATSTRVVPLWPQLEEVLRDYLNQRTFEEVHGKRPPSLLLFPSDRGEMLQDVRKYLDRVGQRGGWREGEIRSKMFRHTYCAARLQSLDQGAPVDSYTVSRELGHSSRSMVERVYAHLGQVRHRAEAVEYRVDQHLERLGKRLEVLTG